MLPRVILVGGWEFTKEDGIDEKIANLTDGNILLIPDASKFPEKQIDRAIDVYKRYSTRVILLEEKAKKLPERTRVVYLGGGQPEKLMEYLMGHRSLLQDITERWLSRKIVLAGSSTGAMAQFEEMLAEDSRGRGRTNLIPGLGLIKNNAVVIPHWNEPNASYEWREEFLENHRGKQIITIDEYTALFWRDKSAEVVGLGTVNIVYEGKINVYKKGDIIKGLDLLT